jgi:hypothetical protein
MRRLAMFSAIMICMLWTAPQSHSDQLKTGIMKTGPSPNQMTGTPTSTPQVPGAKPAPGATTPVPTKQGITAPLGQKATIAVKSPAQGTRHPADKPLTIVWDRSAITTAATVNILLVDKPGGTAKATIKAGAPNTGSFTTWIAPQQYTAAGNSWAIRIETADSKATGHSGSFSFVLQPVAATGAAPSVKSGIVAQERTIAGGHLSPMAAEQEKVSQQVGMVVTPPLAQSNIIKGMEEKKADSTALLADRRVLSDYTIHSIRTVPEDPHTEEALAVALRVENKSQNDGRLVIYYKFKPLEGQSHQDEVHYFSPLVKAKEIKEYTFSHYQIPHLQGKYLLSGAKDEFFSKDLVTTTVHVKSPEDVKVRISKLVLGASHAYGGYQTNSSDKPIFITPAATSRLFFMQGGGFTSQSIVLYQNVTTGGNVWTIDAENIQGDEISGLLPVYASNVPGRYKIWVKNPDGSETDRFQFEVLTPGQSPQIHFWEPQIITDWLSYDQKSWQADVYFYGNGISKEWSTHWVEFNSVSSNMIFKNKADGNGFYHLFLRSVNSPPQEGEIKIWIYNKHPDPAIDSRSNGQWFRIQVKHEPFVIAPPIVQLPSEKQKIVKEDVVVTLKDPPGVRVLNYRLEWRQQLGVFWQPISILGSIAKDPAATQVTRVIPADQFMASGNYQLRVQVEESTESIRKLKPAPEWSAWRTFEVVR